MDQYTLNLLIVGASFALYIGIAIWARAGTTAEFYAANRGVNPVMNGMATAADWMSAASFISMAGLIATVGYGNSTFLMGWTGGYVLLALLLAPYLRKFGKYTVPQFIGDRFYSQGARLTAVVCLIIISVTYVIGQMTGAGVAFSRFLEVNVSTGLWIASAVVFCYAVLGGMKGITYTQVAQYIVLIIAYTIPAIFISLQLTGNPIPWFGLFGTHTESALPLLQKLDQVVTDLGFNAYTAQGSMLNMTLFTLSLMIGTAGLPHVIIRFFTVPKVSDARWSAGWALVFIALLYLTAPAVGAMARLNIIDTIFPGGTQQEAVLYDERPDWMRNWEVTGLLKFEDKNGDGRIQYYNDKSEGFAATAAERGWTGNELTINNDILVLANPEIAQLPGWVIALIAAGGLAAALSTAAGLLLAISSAISHDLIKDFLKPDISEKGELLAARIAMAGAILVATLLGLNPPGFAAQTVALAFGLAAATIFPALMMGIFSKRINSVGATLGMIVGLVVTCLYLFTYLGWFFIAGTNMMENVPANYIFGIPPTAFGPIGALLNFATAYIVSMMTQAPPKHVQDLVESIRVPRGAGQATGH
ncbi:MAG: cation acetate symporter [Alphaproteobacteria bacterium]|uniref:sodium:solute symporter family protein n=1 Tax=Rhizobium/Agrobacterium group TaxID=227290 RepID=UPI0006B9B20C|nr:MULTISPECIES: sodium:solute symporter family protein [Rhizobium/Agrobacterium group]MBU0736957.1 cation acetate symporter [Alphaproteobacteria bacterium]MDM7982088.1 sodium:solute symporter family protein [Rhizobium sp.]AOG10707.1 putative sodium:solute symporter, subfamily protein [Agrobacterium sp. RAC06]KPF60116.1 sodium:solute symporter [Rhizobium sp. AAP116]MBU0831828.1 cation acetate symporter [Alphaproteobacteria bacterium]